MNEQQVAVRKEELLGLVTDGMIFLLEAARQYSVDNDKAEFVRKAMSIMVGSTALRLESAVLDGDLPQDKADEAIRFLRELMIGYMTGSERIHLRGLSDKN